MTKKLVVFGGAVTLVDDDVYEWASKRRWSLGGCKRRYVRAGGQEGHGQRGRRTLSIYLHRLILSAPPDRHVDHINGDTLDNRRENLRLVTRSENAQNQRHANGRSGIRGVVWNKRTSTWIGRIQVDHRSIHVGTYPTKEDAALAVAAARQRHLTHAPVCAEAPIVAPAGLLKGPRRQALVRIQREAGGLMADGPRIGDAARRLEEIAAQFA